MTPEQQLEAQWAELDRAELEIFLAPSDDQRIASGRHRVLAGCLVDGWSNQLANMDDDRLKAITSDILSGSKNELSAARVARAFSVFRELVRDGTPLSWESFLLAGESPWANAIRVEIRERLNDPEEDLELDGLGDVLRSFLDHA